MQFNAAASSKKSNQGICSVGRTAGGRKASIVLEYSTHVMFNMYIKKNKKNMSTSRYTEVTSVSKL